MPGMEHFTFQTQWMADCLLAGNKDNELYHGGLLSNVTYCFFKNGYLLSTSMFCEDLQQWIPIQLTWIQGLSKKYYHMHFVVLLWQFFTSGIIAGERDLLARQLVDFLLAQRNGFVSAYMEVFCVADKARAASMLKGCHQHFTAQVTRIKQNQSLIMANKEVRQPFFSAKEPCDNHWITHLGKLQ